MKQFKVDLTLIRQDGERVLLKLEEYTTAAGIMAAIGTKLGKVTDKEDWPSEDVIVDIPERSPALDEIDGHLKRIDEILDAAGSAVIDLTDPEQALELADNTLPLDEIPGSAIDMTAPALEGLPLSDKTQQEN
jgi:hypothetical protein